MSLLDDQERLDIERVDCMIKKHWILNELTVTIKKDWILNELTGRSRNTGY